MSPVLVIEQSYYLNAPTETVFEALTEPKMLVKWFLAKAHVDPREGGDYDFDWLGGYHYSGKIMRFEKIAQYHTHGRETQPPHSRQPRRDMGLCSSYATEPSRSRNLSGRPRGGGD